MSSGTAIVRALLFLKRATLNVLIVGLLLTFAVDSCPALVPRIQVLKDRISIPIYRLGIWQGSWTLFAPEVRKINLRVKAVVTFQDGKTVTTNSPSWPDMSDWQRFWHYREGKFTDAIRADAQQWMWPSYARWFALNVPHPDTAGMPVARVSLSRSWTDIPFPSVETRKMSRKTWMDFQNAYSYTFYEGGPFP